MAHIVDGLRVSPPVASDFEESNYRYPPLGWSGSVSESTNGVALVVDALSAELKVHESMNLTCRFTGYKEHCLARINLNKSDSGTLKEDNR